MKVRLRDLREISAWAGITALLVAGVLWAHTGICQDSAKPLLPEATVDGCKVTATIEPGGDPYTAAITLSIANPTKEKRDVSLELNWVRKDSTADPMARSLVPTEFKVTTEMTEKITETVAASGQAKHMVTLPIEYRPPEKATLGMPFDPIYALQIASGDGVAELAVASASTFLPKE